MLGSNQTFSSSISCSYLFQSNRTCPWHYRNASLCYCTV